MVQKRDQPEDQTSSLRGVYSLYLLYGCETWPLRAEEERSLDILDRKCLRAICNLTLNQRISNEQLMHMCNQKHSLSAIVKSRRLTWFGHTTRPPSEYLTSQFLEFKPLPNWKKSQGGQTKSWHATMKKDLEPLEGFRKYGRNWDKSWLEIIRPQTEDRSQWQNMVHSILDAELG